MISSSKNTIGYNDRKFILIGIPVISLIISGILFGNMLAENSLMFFGSCFLIGLIYTSSFWIGFRELYFYSIRKFRNQQSKRYGFLMIASIGLYILIKIFLGTVIETYLFDIHSYPGFKENGPHAISEVLSSMVVIIMILAIYESSYLNGQLHKSIIEKQDLQKQNIQSQLDGLRNKVNPHFLFNSLNTLCNLIPESPERAEKFVQQMSRVYRYILEIRDEKLIPLKEELDYLESFKHLLLERFGDNLSISIEIPDSHRDNKIVPLSLQILLENAIKHNIISKEKPLHVKLYINQNGQLVVENNLQVKRQVGNSTKFGLENIKQRYKFLTDKTVEVISTTQNFIVVLPLISTQTNT